MAKGRVNIGKPSTPSFKRSSGSASGVSTLLGYMMGRQKDVTESGAGSEAMPEEIAKQRNDPSSGVQYVNPEFLEKQSSLKAQAGAQEESIKKMREAGILRQNLGRMKGLFDVVPRTKSGIVSRPMDVLGNMIQQQSREKYGPQINRFENVKQAIAGTLVRVIGGETGARLSDFDIKRVVKAVPDIKGDTEDDALIGWHDLYSTIDDVMATHAEDNGALIYEDSGEAYDPTSLVEQNFSQKELGRVKVLTQGNLSELSDDMILQAAEYDKKSYQPEIWNKIVSETRRRKL